MIKTFYAQGGVDISDQAIDQEFALRPVFSLDQQLKIMNRANGASDVDGWFSDIGKFMVSTGTLPSAPDVKTYITDEYMKMVASDPKLKAFATEFDTSQNDTSGAAGNVPAAPPQRASIDVGRLSEEGRQNSGNRKRQCAAVVAEMLAAIEAGGEQSVRDYAQKLDQWTGPIVLSSADIERRSGEVPEAVQRRYRVCRRPGAPLRRSAAQSIHDFSVELQPGLQLGQRLVPVNTAGCYVPTGRYAHIASAYMSIATAKAAGVKTVIACSTPYKGRGIHPYVLYAMQIAGADIIMSLGGVQAIAAMAFGLFTGSRPTSSSDPATSSSPRPSACCSAKSASTFLPARPKSPLSPTPVPILNRRNRSRRSGRARP